MLTRTILATAVLVMTAFSIDPPIEPGVPLELARWRAERYSDVRYKLNLTLEKMSPVLKGTMEIRVNVGTRTPSSATPATAGDLGTRTPSSATPATAGELPPIILDWRKIRDHEEKSQISAVSINGKTALPPQAAAADVGVRVPYEEINEHLVFREGVVAGENVIKLDFTSPILPSGSAITRYIDKEDGSEYIYSLFVPSDASTAFPVFDQPDIKARFTLELSKKLDPKANLSAQLDWKFISNTIGGETIESFNSGLASQTMYQNAEFGETKPISTYVFAFAAGPFERITGGNLSGSEGVSSPPNRNTLPTGRVSASGGDETASSIYVRKSQAEKFKPHAAEVFRLNREAVRYFEEYFDYQFPFSKYDLVLIPEFPFGGMEHAGATFLRESAIIFPQEPTKNDHISRALLIFHEAAHQWFGDTVTMRWFDDLWLKEGFATFTAYKAMERIMPEMNAWKVFYERVKQAAYQTDSTKGTTPIYQEIPNLSAAKSAYGNIVYNKAPAFLRQAEFYLGEDKFQTAVRAFLKKQEFGNAGWEDLVREFEGASNQKLADWAKQWVTQRGMPIFESKVTFSEKNRAVILFTPKDMLNEGRVWSLGTQWVIMPSLDHPHKLQIQATQNSMGPLEIRTGLDDADFDFGYFFPNYGDYGYGIFLLDEKSREYVLKNIQNERDPFLRSMMWGALWDSVREGELDPQVYVETVVRVLSPGFSRQTPKGGTPNVDDESTTALLLNRIGTAMNYYIDYGVGSPRVSKGSSDNAKPSLTVGPPTRNAKPSLTVGPPTRNDLRTRVEDLLIERMRNAETLGQRITYYRALLNIAASENARKVLKEMLTAETQRRGAGSGGNLSGSEGVSLPPNRNTLPTGRVSASGLHDAATGIPLKTKDKFDIVTRLLILGDPDGERLLAELEKTETSDDAKRYAYAARAGIGTAENKAKYWNDFVNNKEISESWIEAAFGPWNSIRHSELTLPYLESALKELPNHKRSRKIFFVNGWLGAFIGGQRSEEALDIINKFLADNPALDKDLKLKILENADVIERAVRIRGKF